MEAIMNCRKHALQMFCDLRTKLIVVPMAPDAFFESISVHTQLTSPNTHRISFKFNRGMSEETNF